jgi:hypothetical protein
MLIGAPQPDRFEQTVTGLRAPADTARTVLGAERPRRRSATPQTRAVAGRSNSGSPWIAGLPRIPIPLSWREVGGRSPDSAPIRDGEVLELVPPRFERGAREGCGDSMMVLWPRPGRRDAAGSARWSWESQPAPLTFFVTGSGRGRGP